MKGDHWISVDQLVPAGVAVALTMSASDKTGRYQTHCTCISICFLSFSLYLSLHWMANSSPVRSMVELAACATREREGEGSSCAVLCGIVR